MPALDGHARSHWPAPGRSPISRGNSLATGFPWNPWGSAWAIPGDVGTVFLQPVAWIGTPGLTLVTVLLAATPVLGRRAMLGGAAVLLLWVGFGVAAPA